MLKYTAPLLTVILLLVSVRSETASSEVRGNTRLETITVAPEFSKNFRRLNRQALLYHPIEKSREKWPLVIYLHGSGGARRAVQKMKWKGRHRVFINPENRKHRTKVLVPQSGRVWDPPSLNRMLDYIIQSNPDIDTRRIYCVGYSMGGKGTWEWAMTSPKRFAAVIPMAFIPDLSKIEGMVKLPIWAMVGNRDSRARTEGIPKMASRLKALGSTVVKISVLAGANHATTARRAFAENGLFDWLFSQALPK